ncbi:MAG: helix-turn-helix domain-containing protein [Solirubrobacterales bacterium]|nr:helix-turn-helix domain-containing protein [Thermoleophilales bacterium]MCO5327217.1 helix-turn-helix domain-containing protein [Solirubrobacterales bacterium]
MLSELGRPATTPELAERLALHPNGVRRQLGVLREAGLVVQRQVRRSQGRPHDEWAVAPGANPGGERPTGYQALAGWLAGAVPITRSRLHEVESAGREIGRDLGAGAGGPPERAIEDVLSALGFQPELEGPANGRLGCRLGNCPYRDSAQDNREVVCTLHRGVMQGILDRVSADAVLTRFVPHDPATAGCEIEIEGLVVEA